jgi:hypothetical protein
MSVEYAKFKMRLKELKHVFKTEEFYIKPNSYIETKNIVRTSYKNPLITEHLPNVYNYEFKFCFVFPRLEATLGFAGAISDEQDKFFYEIIKEKYPQALI